MPFVDTSKAMRTGGWLWRDASKGLHMPWYKIAATVGANPKFEASTVEHDQHETPCLCLHFSLRIGPGITSSSSCGQPHHCSLHRLSMQNSQAAAPSILIHGYRSTRQAATNLNSFRLSISQLRSSDQARGVRPRQ